MSDSYNYRFKSIAEAEDGVTAEAGEVQEEVVGRGGRGAGYSAGAPADDDDDDDDDDDLFVDEEPKPGGDEGSIIKCSPSPWYIFTRALLNCPCPRA